MERMVFQSPKKHRIIAIKALLAENGIPVTSIKLHIRVEWSHWSQAGIEARKKHTEAREKRNELNIPIEEFNDKLNDAQTFELYTHEKYEEAALELIEHCDEETFFGDCIFKSESYDEAFEIYSLLNKNNIPCDDIFPGADAYLLFIDPEYMDKAMELIAHKNNKRAKRKNRTGHRDNDQYDDETGYRKNSLFRFLPLF